jgi:hypothetical protein
MPKVSAPPETSSGGHDLGDDFGMEIERGGLTSLPHALSNRPNGPSMAAHAAPGSGLEVTYQRESARTPRAPIGPSIAARLVAHLVPSVAFAASLLVSMKLAHRHGGRTVTSLLPHAFDASSAMQSGTVSLTTLAVVIGLGFAGVKMSPRSYTIVASAGLLLIASLAMVTVTLVATEENPTPPDGALVIPYVVPMACALLGLGVARHGAVLFLDGGATRRALSVVLAALGGALAFAAVETSTLAAWLP